MAVLGLGQRGFEVTADTSGPAALDRLGREDFDVVVTDLAMAGMNGLELCARIVEIYGGNRGLAADALGIDRKTLYRKLRAYG